MLEILFSDSLFPEQNGCQKFGQVLGGDMPVSQELYKKLDLSLIIKFYHPAKIDFKFTKYENFEL